jgi:signal recognition particle subunit SRP68
MNWTANHFIIPLLGKPNLASFPPSFEPIPNKPLFFDLAREQISFPKLDSKVSSSGGGAGGQQQGGSGWLGGWLGGWGGGKK